MTMQQTQSQAESFKEPATLKEFNACLEALGLQRLGKDAFQQLLQQEGRERLVNALRRARTDSGAQAYLRKVVAAVSSTPPAAGEPPAPPPVATVTPLPQRPVGGGKEDPETSLGGGGGNIAERISIHVYGLRAALTFETDTTRGGLPTISLDAALATDPRQYDWANKVRIQMTRAELPVVLSVLLGYLKGAEFTNHGEGNNKGFSVEDQDSKFFVKVTAKGQPVRAVPMEPEDAFRVAGLFIRPLQAASPWLSSTDIMALVKATVGRMKKSTTGTRQGGGGGHRGSSGGGA